MFIGIIDGIINVFNIYTIFFILIGTIIGIIIGAIPGLGSCVGIALLLPVTFFMDPATGLCMLGAIYGGTVYGGSISAILLCTPGTSASVATSWDGYPMTEKGLGGEALGIATFSSYLGGTFGSLCLLLIAPPLAAFAIKFGPPERFMLAIFGLSVIISVSSKSLLKGLIAGSFGLFLSSIGLDPITGNLRFTFNILYLYEGIPLVPALVGLFSVSQAFDIIGQEKKQTALGNIQKKIKGSVIPTLEDFKKIKNTIIHSSVIGTIIGIIPGAGTSIGAFVGYSEAKRISKNPEDFGKGSIEGVAGAEAANNAVVGGSLVPLLTLGIPGNAASAVFLGGLLIHGLIPGPDLFTKHATITYTLMISLLVANFAMLIFGIVWAKTFAKVANVTSNILAPLIIVFSSIGSYSIRGNIFDIFIMFIFSLLGYFMKKTDFPRAPILLALILGPIAERELIRTIVIFGGNIFGIFIRPIFVVLILLTILSLTYPLFIQKSKIGNIKQKH